jgi:cyclic lactone autoinducer peptide
MRELKDSKASGVKMLNSVALKVVKQNVNTACAWIHHQPQVPDVAKQFRKF